MPSKKTLRLQRDKQHSSTHHKSIQSSNYLLEFSKNDHFLHPLKLQIFWFKKLKYYLYLAKAPFKEANFFLVWFIRVFRNRLKHRIRTKIDKDFINAKNISVSYR